MCYADRICRRDLLQRLNQIAREVTRWNKSCDIRLHKLMSYIRQSSRHSLEGWISDPAQVRKLVEFCGDAFAGDTWEPKSTDGSYFGLLR